MMKDKAVLLVGGAGYVGLVISRYLSKMGYRVIILDNLIYGHIKGINYILYDDLIEFINFDIREDLSDEFIESNNIAHVVILAGLVGDPITKKYPKLSSEINNTAIKKLISKFDESKLINKLIFISTCSNYGLIPSGVKADEDYPLSPLSLYAQDKVNIEKFLSDRRDNLSFSYTILRFATAFGISPRMRLDLSVNEFVYHAFFNKKLEIYDPDTWRPYCHVLDFANLIEVVLSSDKDLTHQQIFNAGSDQNNHTKRGIIDCIQEHIDDVEISFVDGGNDPRNYVVDFSKVSNVLGFSPKVSLRDGVRELINSFEKGFFADFEKDKTHYGNYLIESD